MPQQADGWQPELTYSGDYDHLSGLRSRFRAGRRWLGLGPNPGSEPGREPLLVDSCPELPLPAEAEAFPGRLPWMETASAEVIPGARDLPAQSKSLGQFRADHPEVFDSAGYSQGHQLSHIFDSPHQHPHQLSDLSALIHDTRNMVTTMGLYCDLLEEPGVLSAPFGHYAGELRMVADSSRRLVDRLAAVAGNGGTAPSNAGLSGRSSEDGLDANPLRPHLLRRDGSNLPGTSTAGGGQDSSSNRVLPRPASIPGEALPIKATAFSAPLHRGARAKAFQSVQPIQSFADELMANHRLLSALCGPGITVGLAVDGGNRALPITADDLTRVLVNLVKNAADAMPAGGHIQIDLEESLGSLSLSVADTGPGIDERALESIFTAGYTTHLSLHPELDVEENCCSDKWPTPHRGMGLAIVRTIVTAAGGYVWAANRQSGSSSNPSASRSGGEPIPAGDPQTGAIFILDFPIAAGSQPDAEDS